MIATGSWEACRPQKRVLEHAIPASALRVSDRLCYTADMKPRSAASPNEQHRCRRPGCPNLGKLRSQSRVNVTRTLHLCDECFDRLPAHQLNDLFLQCIGEQK